MNQLSRVEDNRQLSPSQQFRVELDKMADQFAAALPSHIKPEKFQRVVMTAVVSDPDILRADRKSLMESAIRAAQDGLLPDKREGAFVVFNTKVKVDGKDQWIKAVQWMPMVGGIIKRVHQSGDIKMLTARVVYGGDHFRTWIDDTGEHIEYEPAEEQDQSIVRRVFAMATTTDGAVYVEPLSSKDVEKIRNVSKQKDRGPWADWWEEMAKKSAIRRLAKRLPLSVDIHDLLQRDNGLYDLNQEQDTKPSLADRLKAAKNITPEPQAGQQALEGFDGDFHRAETVDASTGEIIEPNTNTESGDPLPPESADAPAQSASAEAGEVPPSPASYTPDENIKNFIRFANALSGTVRNDQLDKEAKIRVIEGTELNWREVIPERHWPKMASLKLSAITAVQDLKAKRYIAFAADMLGCTVEELGGQSNG